MWEHTKYHLANWERVSVLKEFGALVLALWIIRQLKALARLRKAQGAAPGPEGPTIATATSKRLHAPVRQRPL